MIASPSDVESERLIIREVIYDWNVVHSVKERIVLLPVDWESHSSPEMGERPQAIVNKQTVDKCDLLVAVFGTRIGTETGEYPSGTVEEVEKHVASGKPVMLYFSTQLGHSDDFDGEQYAKLEKLKKDYKNRGLCGTYEKHSELSEKFYHHLALTVNNHKIFQQFRDKEISSGLLEENRMMRLEIHKPEILVSLRLQQGHNGLLDSLVVLRIENVGTGAARDVKFATDLSFRVGTPLAEIGALRNGITCLEHGGVMQYVLAPVHKLDELKQTSIEIATTYRDSAKREYEDTFHLDFGVLEGLWL